MVDQLTLLIYIYIYIYKLQNPKKYNNEKSRAYIANLQQKEPKTIHRNNKNLEELKNNDKIKEILDTKKSVKASNNPKILKENSPLLYSEKTQCKSY